MSTNPTEPAKRLADLPLDKTLALQSLAYEITQLHLEDEGVGTPEQMQDAYYENETVLIEIDRVKNLITTYTDAAIQEATKEAQQPTIDFLNANYSHLPTHSLHEMVREVVFRCTLVEVARDRMRDVDIPQLRADLARLAIDHERTKDSLYNTMVREGEASSRALKAESDLTALRTVAAEMAGATESALANFSAMPEATPHHDSQDSTWGLWTRGCNQLKVALASYARLQKEKTV